MGDQDEVESFAFHVRGGDQAIGVIAEILGRLNRRAVDPQSETGLSSRSTAIASLQAWRAYRESVIDESS